MAKFMQVPQTFLFRKYLGFWGNLLRNYDGECQDGVFFAPVLNSFDRRMAVRLLLDAFTEQELAKLGAVQMAHGRFEPCGPLNEIFRLVWNDEDGRGRLRVVLDAIRDYLEHVCGTVEENAIERRFGDLKRVLKLSDLEGEIVVLAYLCGETGFVWPCRVEICERPLYYAMALDRSYDEVCEALAEGGRLRKMGVLNANWSFNRSAYGNFINGSEAEPVERRFYRLCDLGEALPWSFYGELAAGDGALLKRILRGSSGRCNVLFYGVPGTGKTSFARSLAKELGRRAFETSRADDEEMRFLERSVRIQVANEQLDPEDSMLIVDEADELLGDDLGGLRSVAGLGLGHASKGEVNMLLDGMKVSTIWISNVPAEEMDESVRRRFDYSVCFTRLNAGQRTEVWRNLVGKFGLGEVITATKLVELASRYETNAGGIATVLENLKRINPSQAEVDDLIGKLMKPHCRLMGIREKSRFLPAKGYSLEGLNVRGKISPEEVVAAARNFLNGNFGATSEDSPRMNILLFGPPGTGKTEFVKYLGKALDRKVLVKRASDILDQYVGNTEKRIAEAFRQAEAEHAILFFDEIDGLVRDREGASQSWQVTQVNELLQQMENFDGIMVAATNFSVSLDPAAMRRFTYKLEFDYLDEDGKRLFFERMFKTKLSDAEFSELDQLGNLAPGDFRTVRQELFYLGRERTNRDRIAALQSECALKKDGRRPARIGFAACWNKCL